MKRPVVILGAGGHAKVLIDLLVLQGIEVLGLIEQAGSVLKKNVLGVPLLGDETVIDGYRPELVDLILGLGSVDVSPVRKLLYERFRLQGYRFRTAVHTSAIVSAHVALGEGVQLMAASVIQAGCQIGSNCIINTRASVDHDCKIDDHVHVAPGVTISGGVRIGEMSHIGTGAVIVQGVKIGRNCLIASGAVVVRDVQDGSRVAGVPAREIV